MFSWLFTVPPAYSEVIRRHPIHTFSYQLTWLKVLIFLPPCIELWRGARGVGEQDFSYRLWKVRTVWQFAFFVPFFFSFISITFSVCIPASPFTLYIRVSQLFALTVIYRCNVAYGYSTLQRGPPLLNRHVLFRNMNVRVGDKGKVHPRTGHEGPEGV
jgi:hypothetical protein